MCCQSRLAMHSCMCFFYSVFVALPVAQASSNGMDMSMDGAMDLATGNMLTYLHFTPGDTLWFQGWVPASKGAMVGTCIGLFLLALVERWISAARAVMQMHWSRQARIIQLPTDSETNLPTTNATPVNEKSSSSFVPLSVLPVSSLKLSSPRSFPPFMLSHDLPRGILLMVQAALNYAFMLTVMTFQVGFILSLIVGLGVGEMLFGRFGSHTLVAHV